MGANGGAVVATVAAMLGACGDDRTTPTDAAVDGQGGFEAHGVVYTDQSSQARMLGVAPLAGGDFVAGGFFTDSSVTVNGVAVTGPAAGQSATNPLLVRFTPAAAIAYAKSFDAGTVGEIDELAIAPNGNLVIVGRAGGSVDLGNGIAIASGATVFLAELDPAGTPLRVTAPYSGGVPYAKLAIAPNGTIVLAGTVRTGSATLSFPDGTTLTSAGGDDSFIASYAADGTFGWVRAFGGSGRERLDGVAIDELGNIDSVGFTTSPSVDFGGGPQALPDPVTTFVHSLTASGAFRFATLYGGANPPFWRAISARSGGMTVSGACAGTIDLGATIDCGDTLFSKGLVAELDPNGMATGTLIASEQTPSTYQLAFVAIGTAPDGTRIVVADVAGNSGTSATITFGSYQFTASDNGVLVAELDAAFHVAHARFIPGPIFTSAAACSSVDAAFSGFFNSSVDFGTGPVAPMPGEESGFAALVTL